MTSPPVPRLLVVDDDTAKRYTISRQLRAAGFAVEEAATAADGLRLAKTVPDLVVLDIKLPDLDGIEVCKRIKQAPETSSVMVLALSARYTTAPDRTRGLDGGADAYLVHPVDAQELIATVRALLRIRQAERLHRTITATTTVGLCLLDAEGRCTFLNAAAEQMLGRTGAQVHGRSLFEVLRPRTPEGVRVEEHEWSVTATLRDAAPVHSQRALVDGAADAALAVEVSAKRIGVELGAVVEIKDISALIRAEKQRELFLATLGHDLRGPLQTVIMGAQLIEQNEHLERRERETLRRIRSSANRMERLIAQILEFARTLVEGVPLSPRPANLAEVVTAVLRDTLAREPGREIELRGVTRLTGAWDSDRVAQIVENLLGNAIRHGEGLVTIALSVDGPFAVLTVHNHGAPIPPALLPVLFDPFRRGSSEGGVGLGLFIVDKIVRAHGGAVTVTSTAEAGTTFEVRLPYDPGS